MPISGEEFEQMPEDGDETDVTPGTNEGIILEFLREHPDQAFKRGDIAEQTVVAEGAVGPSLVRLRERGRVDHRGQYWRVSDHERSMDEGVALASAAMRAREDAEADEVPEMDTWQESAVDPRARRDE